MKKILFFTILVNHLSFGASGSFSSRIARKDIKSCVQKITEHTNRFNDVSLEKMCEINNFNESFINGIRWETIFSCLNSSKAYSFTSCFDFSFSQWINSTQYEKCIDKMLLTSEVPSAYLCDNESTGREILSENYETCIKNLPRSRKNFYSRESFCSSPNGQTKVNCYLNLKKFTSPDSAWGTCNNYSYNAGKIAEPSFLSCMDDSNKSSFDLGVRIDICQNYDSANVLSCMDKGESLFKTEVLLRKCKEYGFQGRISDPVFFKCVNKLKKLGAKEETVANNCSSDIKAMDSIANEKEFTSCVEDFPFAKLDVDSKINSCLDSKVRSIHSEPFFRTCIERGIDAGKRGYFALSNSLGTLVEDCLGDFKYRNKSKKGNEYLSFLHDYNFHSNTKFIDGILIGGISAIHFDENLSKFYALSDDRGIFTNTPPRIYIFDYKMDENELILNDSELLVLKEKTIQVEKIVEDIESGEKTKVLEKFTPHINIDPEGMVFLDDGKILISSEVENLEGNDFLKEFNLNTGEFVKDYPVNDTFRPITTSVKNCSKELQVSNVFSMVFGSGTEIDKQDQSGGNENEIWVEKCHYTYENKGIQDNKGFEALATTDDKNFIFVSNEAPLKQDISIPNKRFSKSSSKEKVRISKYEKGENGYKEASQYFYVLEDAPDNGLVEMIALDEQTLLALERSWDNYNKKITARLFLVDLSKADDISKISDDYGLRKADEVKKIELLNFDDMKYFFSPGFRNLENLEAMTLGPTLSNGKRTIIFAADNNFRMSQRSSILVFEIDLKKIQVLVD